MGALYSTIGARVVAADPYVIEMIVLQQIFHCFEEGWTIVSNNLVERSPPAKDILIDPAPNVLAVSALSIRNSG
jgi:hypothetical protein